jgi:hypothetical protein
MGFSARVNMIEDNKRSPAFSKDELEKYLLTAKPFKLILGDSGI